MRIGEKPQERLERFFDFFTGAVAETRQNNDEGVVENWRTAVRSSAERRLVEARHRERRWRIQSIFDYAFSRLWKQFASCHRFVSKPA
ncbi:hypothetical protein OIU34_27515 [Pararhizobium sp. BT-229]|uniref:hypothetical protein n=1 Tax=Pararhizobium sp. BT-229 TaxID=2986923 RepID=UPI0021F7AA05|nr:hypothetical protein [Pararhizobium sp. BT-229]MCV9965629.1 hypothetical protein [Pararhizobium sp. BT-229]